MKKTKIINTNKKRKNSEDIYDEEIQYDEDIDQEELDGILEYTEIILSGEL